MRRNSVITQASAKDPISVQLIILLASLSALVAAAIDMYLPAFPTIATSLAITPGQVQQTLTIFLIGLGIGQGLYGPLLDRFGRKPPLLIGIGLFTLGSLFAALTTSFEGLLVARFLQAIGAAAGAVDLRPTKFSAYLLDADASYDDRAHHRPHAGWADFTVWRMASNFLGAGLTWHHLRLFYYTPTAGNLSRRTPRTAVSTQYAAQLRHTTEQSKLRLLYLSHQLHLGLLVYLYQ